MVLTTSITILYFACGAYLFLLAWLIIRENPRQPLSRSLGILLFFAAIASIFAAFGFLLAEQDISSAILTRLEAVFVIWEFFFPQLFVFALRFPTLHRLLETQRGLLLLLYLPPICHILLLSLFQDGSEISELFDPANLLPMLGIFLEPVRLTLKFFLNALSLLRDYHEAYFAVVNLLYVVSAIATMHLGYTKIRSPQLRQQVRLVIWGFRVGAGFYALAFLLPEILRIQIVWWQAHLLALLGLLLGIGALSWAIIRYRFLEIQYIIRRGFIVSVASALLAGLYLLLFSQVNRLATLALGANATLVQAALLLLTVLGFQPVLNIIEFTVDRLFGKGLGESRQAVQALGREILTIQDPGRLREKVVNGLSESMLLEVVYLFLPDQTSSLTAGSATTFSLAAESPVVHELLQQRRPVYTVDLLSQHPDPELGRNLSRLRILLLFPVCHREKLHGVLAVGRKITHTAFSGDELSLLLLLCDQIAISLENFQLYKEKLDKERLEKELAVAEEIQRMLLPQCLPSIPGLEIAAFNRPSRQVGGDYYDFLPLHNDRLGLAIGDVVGKGIPGALLMSNLQAAFRAYAMQEIPPREVVARINNHLVATTAAEKFVTFLYGILDVRRRQFMYTNGGHNYPLLVRDTGIQVLDKVDLVTGVRRDHKYRQETIKLNSGELLVFYTDGITEAHGSSHELYGEQRFQETLQRHRQLPVAEIINRVYEDVVAHCGNTNLVDDFTLIVARIL